ncbi:hypothetical protein CHUAL_003172 [Chamberlinius hualienensis]
MIGYLYAIQHGAKYIYDTDDDNHPTGNKINFFLNSTMNGLIYDDESQLVVNPLPHFGQDNVWPRGYPLEAIAIKPNQSYQLCTFNTPAIQQGLVNGDPDVDAVYRLINRGSDTRKHINITFDVHAPPITLPSGVFVPFNSQNTLFTYEAFWALFLPTTVDFRVTDIWRGYWAQKLLWLVGHNLAYLPPNAMQFRNPHNYLKDFDEEIQIYKDAGNLIRFLNDWKCSDNNTFFQCVIQLTAEMVENNYLELKDLTLVKLWLDDLQNVQYRQPSLTTRSLREMCIQPKSSNWVYYSPSPSINHGFKDMFEFCEDNFVNSSSLKDSFQMNLHPTHPKLPSYNFDNILLVVVFNFPHINNIRMLEAVYRDHFPNILFCSETQTLNNLFEKINSSWMTWRTNGISFVNASVIYQGWYGYECAVRAIEMNYNVDGYMLLGDDILFKFWKILPFNYERSRIQNDTYGPHCYQNRYDDKSSSFQWGPWWPRKCGKKGTNLALDEIVSISENSSDSRSTLFKQYINNRYSNEVNMTLVSYSMSDFYYISGKDSAMFSEVIKVFLKHKVYLDIAVPTTLSGCRALEPQTDDGFFGTSVWYSNRKVPFKFLYNDSVYVHPVKMNALVEGSDLLKKYCTNYISELFSNW